MKLTLEHIRHQVRSDRRLEETIDLDEPGKAILYTADGFTWSAADGNRTVEGFVYSDKALDPRDTLSYFRGQLAMIEPVAPSKGEAQ